MIQLTIQIPSFPTVLYTFKVIIKIRRKSNPRYTSHENVHQKIVQFIKNMKSRKQIYFKKEISNVQVIQIKKTINHQTSIKKNIEMIFIIQTIQL